MAHRTPSCTFWRRCNWNACSKCDNRIWSHWRSQARPRTIRWWWRWCRGTIGLTVSLALKRKNEKLQETSRAYRESLSGSHVYTRVFVITSSKCVFVRKKKRRGKFCASDRWKQRFCRGEAPHRKLFFGRCTRVSFSFLPSFLFVGRLSSSKVAFQFSAHKDKSEVGTAEVWIINFASSVFSDPLAPWRVTL